jgi:hypothetical protein
VSIRIKGYPWLVRLGLSSCSPILLFKDRTGIDREQKDKGGKDLLGIRPLGNKRAEENQKREVKKKKNIVNYVEFSIIFFHFNTHCFC